MKGKKPNKKILDKIIENYLNGMSCKESTKEFNLSYSVCQKELKRREIKARLNGTWQSPSKDKKDLMIHNYINGMSSYEAAESIGVSFTTCLKELKRRNIKTREIASYSRARADYDFFERIDSEEKAYWLGFISADGYLCGKATVGIQLKQSDKNHLNKFSRSIKFEGRIREFIHSGYLSCSIVLNNKKLFDDLIKYGLSLRKSLKISPYNFEDKNLSIAYWRGIFDGDGHITKYKSKTHASGIIYDIGLTGNKFVISNFIEFLRENNIDTSVKVNDRGNIQTIKYRRLNIVQQIASLLYKDSSIYLDRKYNVYKEVSLL